jgi:septal ring factor EnvC (AmiA/AmiB activator)
LNGNREELPHLETSRARLEALLAEAQEAADRQAQHTAAKQEASQQFQTALAEGERLATVLQLSVKSHYGIRSEKLADFGLQPFRGRRPRRVSPELKPPAPAPAPAPAPEASRA